MSGDHPPVLMPIMSPAQAASWHGLLDLQEKVPTGWTLVGGQLVQLHCAERDMAPERPTNDVDTVVDVRAIPTILATFTRGLLDLDFEPDTSGEGLQHRWRRGDAQIDVLLPEGVGARAAARLGAGGAPTLSTPGGTQALQRTERVHVQVEDRVGVVPRPSLVGALVMKAAAHTVAGDVARGRHRFDFVTLARMVERADFNGAGIEEKDRKRLRTMIAACRGDAIVMEDSRSADSLTRLERGARLR